MPTSLVTGGAGFIGSHLVERLVESGENVVVVDNFSSGSMTNLSAVADRVRVIDDDVINILDHKEQLRTVRNVYHLAAQISGYESIERPDEYMHSNVTGVLRVVDLCRSLESPHIVFASSSTVYGDGAHALRSESDNPQPMSVYALSKLVGEHLLSVYRDIAGFSHVSLRLFNVYGPRQSLSHPYANVTCKFAHAAALGGHVRLYGDGLQTRDFVYVDDVIDAMLLVNDRPQRSVYNVGTGTDTSIAELLGLAEKYSSSEMTLERLPGWPNDIRAIRADVSRIRSEFGFGAKTSLSRGLQLTIDNFKAHG